MKNLQTKRGKRNEKEIKTESSIKNKVLVGDHKEQGLQEREMNL